MTRLFNGHIQGRTIELDDDPGIAAGQAVEVSVRAVSASENTGGATWVTKRDLPAGHGCLFRPHAASRAAHSSVYPV